MINFRFSLENPWWDRFEILFWKAGGTPFKHKFWELQAMKTDDLIAVDLRITSRCDHAGIDLWLGLLGYSINFNLYDNRHWNTKEGRWVVYTEEDGNH